MKKIIFTVAFILLSTSAFAAMLSNFISAPAKKAAEDYTRKGFKVRIEQGSPAKHLKEIGWAEEISGGGRNVPPGSEIVLKVFAATRPVPMTSFVGQKADEAAKFFEERGIPYTTTPVMGKCQPGTVSTHTPGSGEMYTPGTQVVLSVCAAGTIVPNYIGKRLSQFEHPGTSLIKTGQVGRSGKVVRQDPQPGTIIPRGTPVTVEFASDGSTVSNYIGEKASSVQREVEVNLDVKLEIVGNKKGKIVRQSIPAGTKVPYGTAVRLEAQ